MARDHESQGKKVRAQIQDFFSDHKQLFQPASSPRKIAITDIHQKKSFHIKSSIIETRRRSNKKRHHFSAGKYYIFFLCIKCEITHGNQYKIKKKGIITFPHRERFQNLVESKNSSGHIKVQVAARPPPEASLVAACRGSSSRLGQPIQKGPDSIGASWSTFILMSLNFQ